MSFRGSPAPRQQPVADRACQTPNASRSGSYTSRDAPLVCSLTTPFAERVTVKVVPDTEVTVISSPPTTTAYGTPADENTAADTVTSVSVVVRSSAMVVAEGTCRR